VLAAVHRGDARIIERVRLLAEKVRSRKQLVTHPVPIVAQCCKSTRRVVRLLSVALPMMSMMSMSGSRINAGP
jgi:hypothetical protein